jgi:outer membrane lipoprotein-sorting protein
VGLLAAVIIPSADELLTQSLETLETVTDGHAIVEATAELPEKTVSGTFEVWGKFSADPDGRPSVRVEVLTASEAELVGLTAVSDGTQSWLYNPNRNTVVVGQAEELAPLLVEKFAGYEGEWGHGGDFDPETADIPETPAEAVAKMLEYFTAERNGQEEVAGTDAYLLRLIPIPEQMPDEFRVAGGYINLWLRTGDKLPLAAEYAEGALGYGKVQATLAEINTGLDDSIFTFVIPEGVEVIEATELVAELGALEHSSEAVDFETLTPTDLPEETIVAETQQIGGAVIQRYNLPEGRSFVVAQGPSMPLDVPAEATSTETVIVRGVEGTLYGNDEDTRALLTWSEGEVSFLVGGDLSAEQAAAIAESLQ